MTRLVNVLLSVVSLIFGLLTSFVMLEVGIDYVLCTLARNHTSMLKNQSGSMNPQRVNPLVIIFLPWALVLANMLELLDKLEVTMNLILNVLHPVKSLYLFFYLYCCFHVLRSIYWYNLFLVRLEQLFPWHTPLVSPLSLLEQARPTQTFATSMLVLLSVLCLKLEEFSSFLTQIKTKFLFRVLLDAFWDGFLVFVFFSPLFDWFCVFYEVPSVTGFCPRCVL